MQFAVYPNRPWRGWETHSILFRTGPDEEIPIIIKAKIHRVRLGTFTWQILGVICERANIQRGSTKVNVTHPTPVCKPEAGREQAPKLLLHNPDYRDSHYTWSGFWGACHSITNSLGSARVYSSPQAQWSQSRFFVSKDFNKR